ncbi:DUF6566 family protein [Paraburkholderia silvatlantica]|uniref:DUF6566 domain-containing protein n=1 Tax=Paraburkholderia silvatlantica TaxID=321895 RepID=A0ABR6FHI1_9BURK|nr:DUF6566 family protein [Paraburkholderia silvatlantica]MBB2926552.1 hypothetical protein [Paraburkholderia silvatlantica]PVY37807.1 hypothetical protein C7411_101424 [Paraburkholderia silvatlantica]PXW42771.1 hypothetical protein C7413_101426 [Paraburkholderia silvatlantica]
MDNLRSQSWKGFTIETGAFPVRHCALPHAGRDAYVAVVRIRRAQQTVADWHLPRYAQHWASPDEAHREAVEYAIRAINAGCLTDTGSPARFLA